MLNICDYMIIQRDNDGYGRACLSGKKKYENSKTVVARVVREDDGLVVVPWQMCEINGDEWKIELVIPEGGLYRAEARETAEEFNPYFNRYDWAGYCAIAHHIGVGDVFIMAGQSNMSGYGKEPAYDPPELGVHLLNKSCQWGLAAHPLAMVIDNSIDFNDDSSGTSPALSFAKAVKRRLGVPVGLVSCALGGSSLESWNPAEPDCYLYNDMKNMVEKAGNTAGMIWYQGCNDCNDEESGIYEEKFSQSLNLWRKQFGDIPVVTCQLNRHAYKDGNDKHWGIVREAQRQCAIKEKNVFIVPTCDLPTVDGIHNSSAGSIVLGERMAAALLKGYYNKPGYLAPNISKVTKSSDTEIKISFFENQNIKTMDDNACGLNIEDEKGLMKCTKVSVTPTGLVITAERKIEGKAYFHAYWEKEQPPFFVRDIFGAPMLSCYGVEIE